MGQTYSSSLILKVSDEGKVESDHAAPCKSSGKDGSILKQYKPPLTILQDFFMISSTDGIKIRFEHPDHFVGSEVIESQHRFNIYIFNCEELFDRSTLLVMVLVWLSLEIRAVKKNASSTKYRYIN
jgi:hypothetical protein